MKGIIHNLIEDVVTAHFGADAWDDLLDDAGVEGAYTAVGNYADAETAALVAAASRRLDLGEQDVLRFVGSHALPMIAKRYPAFFVHADGARGFVLTLNDVIHPEVRKLWPGATPPEFTFADAEDGTLMVTYDSARRMCGFAEGLIQGAAAHYGESVEIAQPRCMHRGAALCDLHLRFGPAA